jgi:hypothetical protein
VVQIIIFLVCLALCLPLIAIALGHLWFLLMLLYQFILLPIGQFLFWIGAGIWYWGTIYFEFWKLPIGIAIAIVTAYYLIRSIAHWLRCKLRRKTRKSATKREWRH